MEAQNPNSYHIFLFPFQWRFPESERKGDLNAFRKSLKADLAYQGSETTDFPESKWKHQPFRIKDHLEYNEYNYYHSFAREVLFDQDQNLKRETGDSPVLHFEYDLGPVATYAFQVSKLNWDESLKKGYPVRYELKLDNLLLNIYETGVGVISFHLRNDGEDTRYQEPQTILDINQFGRRIYPPFLPGKVVSDQGPINGELADWIEVNLGDGRSPFREEFKEYRGNRYMGNPPFRLPVFIKGVLGNSFREDWALNEPNDGKIGIAPVLDDRNFVVSWYRNAGLFNTPESEEAPKGSPSMLDWFNSLINPEKKEKEIAENQEKVKSAVKIREEYRRDFWYKYLFVDHGDKTCQNAAMEARQLEAHTYDRWLNWDTIYGICRYSFVCLSNNPPDFILGHIRTMYYKMAELSLVQRASLLVYSDETSEISRGEVKRNEVISGKSRNTIEKIRDLNGRYLHFVNVFYFREVTAQEQGIELYDLLQDKMRIGGEVKNLNHEINELQNYSELLAQAERRDEEDRRIMQEKSRNDLERKKDEAQNLRNERLSLIGVLFVIPTFLVGYLGMNILGEEIANLRILIIIFLGIALAPLLILSYRATKHDFKFGTKSNIRLLICSLVFSLGILVAPVFTGRTPKLNSTNESNLPPQLNIPGPENSPNPQDSLFGIPKLSPIDSTQKDTKNNGK